MTVFHEGQRVKVNIEFEGNVSYVNLDGSVDVRPTENHDTRLNGELEYVSAEFVTLIVDNWPPRIGDVWALPDGTEYFVRRHAHDSDKLVLASDLLTNAKFFYNEICGEFETFKALGPVLVRRK